MCSLLSLSLSLWLSISLSVSISLSISFRLSISFDFYAETLFSAIAGNRLAGGYRSEQGKEGIGGGRWARRRLEYTEENKKRGKKIKNPPKKQLADVLVYD